MNMVGIAAEFSLLSAGSAISVSPGVSETGTWDITVSSVDITGLSVEDPSGESLADLVLWA